MGLFGRKRRKDADAALTSDPALEDATGIDDDLDHDDLNRDDLADGDHDEGGLDGEGLNDGGAQEEDSGASDGPPTDHLHGGPYDSADAPEGDRIDLGGIQIPAVDGMELRMEMDKRRKVVTGANLLINGSALQLQAFAAPKSRGLWQEVRTSLRDSVVKQGGTAETRQGPFGTELVTRLPAKRSNGRTGYRPARFVGIDGPRWFVRAIITGRALSNHDAARQLEELLSQVVVVRGSEAMAPQEMIPLSLPGQRPGLIPQGENPLLPLERGPEITQIG